MKKVIATSLAPQAIGTYSQAIQVEKTLYISGQIPLNPETMEMVKGDFSEQVHQVFKNLSAVMAAAQSDLSRIVKLNVYVLDLENFAIINEVMENYFLDAYPARAVVQVSRLPKDAVVEMDAVAVLDV